MEKTYSYYSRSLFLIALCLVLGACGIKPKNVDPPEGAEKSTFPAVYPDPQTDPKPGMESKDRLLK